MFASREPGEQHQRHRRNSRLPIVYSYSFGDAQSCRMTITNGSCVVPADTSSNSSSVSSRLDTSSTVVKSRMVCFCLLVGACGISASGLSRRTFGRTRVVLLGIFPLHSRVVEGAAGYRH